MLKKRDSKLRELLRNYKLHFYLILTNKPAMILIVGCFFRMWMSSIYNLYLNEYMKVYKQDYNVFAAQTSASSFFGGIISTFITGIILEHYGPKYEMTIPMICIFKTVFAIPEMFMIFDQQSNFTLSMIGIHI